MAQQGGDSTGVLIQACGADLFPTDPLCLRTFMFDICFDWPTLLGLYIGIFHNITDLMDKSYKADIRRAVQTGQLVETICDIYVTFHREAQYGGSGYWKQFETIRDELAARMRDKTRTPVEGDKVCLVGLKKAVSLNSVGTVSGPVNPDTGRYPVRLQPLFARAQVGQPVTVRTRRENLEVVPAGTAAAVLLHGVHIYPAYSAGRRDGRQAELYGEWRDCPVPTLLGVPLALFMIARSACQPGNEQMATFLLVHPVSGLAPMDVQVAGVGPALVVRTDGRDFTVPEMLKLHAYLEHLMDIWNEGTPSETWDQRRQRVLTPGAFEAYTTE